MTHLRYVQSNSESFQYRHDRMGNGYGFYQWNMITFSDVPSQKNTGPTLAPMVNLVSNHPDCVLMW